MPLKVEHVNDALPNRPAFERFRHRHRLDELSWAAVHSLDCIAKLVSVDFGHALQSPSHQPIA